jgi:hypothetical protein
MKPIQRSLQPRSSYGLTPTFIGKELYSGKATPRIFSERVALPANAVSIEIMLRWRGTTRSLIPIFSLALLVSAPHCVRAQSPTADPQAPPDRQTLPQTDATVPAPQPSLMTPLKPQTAGAHYVPVTRRQRVRWVLTNSFGPPELVVGLFSAGISTAMDRPPEYDTHWDGFGERYGMRFTSIVPGNVMEASLGAIWGEDPRYFRVPDQHLGGRLKSIVKQTFVARHSDGSFAPAYARFIAIPASNFLSNTWRPQSEANTQDALIRTAEGFAGRMAANAFVEFWPDMRTHIFRRSE